MTIVDIRPCAVRLHSKHALEPLYEEQHCDRVELEIERAEDLLLHGKQVCAVKQLLLLLAIDYLDHVVIGGGFVFVDLGSKEHTDDSKLDQRRCLVFFLRLQSQVVIGNVDRQEECLLSVTFHLVNLFDELHHGEAGVLSDL